ncbi:MAG: Holliday junction branch migration protein RuvA [bacterium]
MFAYISGTLIEKSPTRVVLDVGGLGYEIQIPVSTYEKLKQIGEKTRLFTFLYVREDILQLYGFSSEDERRMFLRLISVSGVGPRMAQGILSKLSVRNFVVAITSQDYSVLTQVPGIGNKMAQRLVMELRDKFPPVESSGAAQSPDRQRIGEEAISALVSLGYREGEAQKKVGNVLSSNGGNVALEDLVKKALQARYEN